MKELKTTKEVVEFFRAQGRNIIPIIKGSKMPTAEKGVVMGWKKDGCNVEIKEGDPIAMLHGPWGGTWAADLDSREIPDRLFEDIKLMDNQLAVKSPNGYHMIFEIDGDDVPDKDTTFYHTTYEKNNPETSGLKVDIRYKGYTLLPFSTHPKSEILYGFHSPNYIPKKHKWSKFVTLMHHYGFFRPSDLEETRGADTKYKLGDLLAGKFAQGTRRVKQKSLYIKLRARGDPKELAIAKTHSVNLSCLPPTDENEFNENMKSAEGFYLNVVEPTIRDKPKKAQDKKEKENRADLAKIIMSQMDLSTNIFEEILFYEDGVYKKDGKFNVQQRCRELWDEININTSDIIEIKHNIRDATGYRHPDEYDADYKKINMKNGVYDIMTGELLPHDPKYLSLIQYDIDYDPSKGCPKKFLKFLSSSLECDYRKMRTVLEMMALCFIPRNIIEKAFMHVGKGANGKSTLFNIQTAMLGIENITAKTIQDLEAVRFSASALEGKSANISADVGKRGIKNTELIKKIIGGDPCDCERKGIDSYPFRPHVTMEFSANELPEVDDSSDGFARKFELIMWDKTFNGKDRDTSFRELQDDKEEMSRIMNLLYPIMRRLIITKKLRYESTVEETRKVWLKESDSVERFIDTKCERGEKFVIGKSILYQAYINFCKDGQFRKVSIKTI